METNEEKTIPVEALKDVLNAYDKVYQRSDATLSACDYKLSEAKETLLSLLSYLLNIVMIVIFWVIAVVASHSDATIISILLTIICAIIMCFFAGVLILSLVYFQPIPGKPIKRLRFRIGYHIVSLYKDFKEIKQLRKKFNIKASTLALIFSKKSAMAEAFECLSDWAYALEYDSVLLIDDYNDAFSGYKDYVNLDSQWNICGELLKIINSGRADNLKDALAILDMQEFKEKVNEEIKSAKLEAMRARSAAMSARAEAEKAKREARRRY